jgi:hypothetical protein
MGDIHITAALIGCVGLGSTSLARAADVPPEVPSPGLMFLDYVDLAGGPDGVAVIDLDPGSPEFGKILQRVDVGVDTSPHHLYFDRDEERLYTTAVGGACLYELVLARDAAGVPRIEGVVPIDTGGQTVGEDMFFTADGRYLVTFMGGFGAKVDGSIGVFDAATNELLDTVVAPFDPTGQDPFVLYPHGLSVNEELGRVMVTSTVHPDAVSGVGNTVTTLDLATMEPLKTQLVADDPTDLSAPVEVLLGRGELPDVAVVTTMLGGDIWTAAYDPAAGLYGDFGRAVEGDDYGVSWPLELYVHTDGEGARELFVTFGIPGVVHVYDADQLPVLELKRTLPARAGAHHLVFFEDRAGRELVAVQNNLLELPDLDSGYLTVVDLHSGEIVGEVDLRGRYELSPQSIESAYGPGFDIHH